MSTNLDWICCRAIQHSMYGLKRRFNRTCDMSEQEISRRHDKSRFNKRPSKNSLSRHADITSILFPFKACWRAVIQKNHNELLLGSFSHHGCRCWCTDGPHAVSFGRGCSADLREHKLRQPIGNIWRYCFQRGRICFPFLNVVSLSFWRLGMCVFCW